MSAAVVHLKKVFDSDAEKLSRLREQTRLAESYLLEVDRAARKSSDDAEAQRMASEVRQLDDLENIFSELSTQQRLLHSQRDDFTRQLRDLAAGLDEGDATLRRKAERRDQLAVEVEQASQHAVQLQREIDIARSEAALRLEHRNSSIQLQSILRKSEKLAERVH
jgi:chromosome segregation ATPase